MTVKCTLDILRLNSWQRVVIRHKLTHGFEVLGGGYPDSIIRRFGDKKLISCDIFDGALILYVD